MEVNSNYAFAWSGRDGGRLSSGFKWRSIADRGTMGIGRTMGTLTGGTIGTLTNLEENASFGRL